MSVDLEWLDVAGLRWAQRLVSERHYLRCPVDPRCCPQGYAVLVAGERAGVLLFGRPESTICRPWYGSLAEVASGRVACSRWQVINLARVYLLPEYQMGGRYCRGDIVPGFMDRQWRWHSRLASHALGLALDRIVLDYLLARPPCFLEEPYSLGWCLSYQESTIHKGTLYAASGFERYRENARGLVTWRKPLRALTPAEDARVRQVATEHPRSRRYRASRVAAGQATAVPLFAAEGVGA